MPPVAAGRYQNSSTMPVTVKRASCRPSTPNTTRLTVRASVAGEWTSAVVAATSQSSRFGPPLGVQPLEVVGAVVGVRHELGDGAVARDVRDLPVHLLRDVPVLGVAL